MRVESGWNAEPEGVAEVRGPSRDSCRCQPNEGETIPNGCKNAPGIEGGDRPASLSGKRGDHKWDDL